jgi:hypothetical protein
MDFYFSVIADESQFAEFVHEETDAGSGGANHLCQCFLTDIQVDARPVRSGLMSQLGQKAKYSERPHVFRCCSSNGH